MVRSGSECCVLGLKSSVQASLFGLACAALGAVVASLCWASLELEVTASPRLIEPVRTVSSNSSTTDATQHHEHHTHHCDDCAFCRARAKKAAEQLNAPFIPIHKRVDYTVQPPDILTINVTALAESPESDKQQIQGEHLVNHDGNVDLGAWGKLNVAGKTTAEIQSAVEELVDAAKSGRSVSISVHAQNSHVYYIIDENGFGSGDSIQRVACIGNETVLDAITKIGSLNEMGRRRIWIAHPSPGSDVDTVTPIKWQWTSPTTVVITNPALQPGDRVFIARQPSWMAFIEHASKLAHARQAQQPPAYEPAKIK